MKKDKISDEEQKQRLYLKQILKTEMGKRFLQAVECLCMQWRFHGRMPTNPHLIAYVAGRESVFFDLIGALGEEYNLKIKVIHDSGSKGRLRLEARVLRRFFGLFSVQYSTYWIENRSEKIPKINAYHASFGSESCIIPNFIAKYPPRSSMTTFQRRCRLRPTRSNSS